MADCRERAPWGARGLPGLLVYGKHQGLIPEIKPLLDEMLATGFFLDDSRYQSLLRQVGEWR